MKLFTFIVLFLISCSLLSQQNEIEKGIILDSIHVNNKPGESFALYLPTTHDSALASPVVFIFEPMARGRVGIEPFLKASEEYGYILICSNNSKNGPYETNYAIANNLFPEVLSMFTIDPKRIYTAGFSGGARLAASIAIQSEKIAGVISCGAAFNLKSRGLPSTQTFSYACIMGDEDMNYNELQFTNSYLKKTPLSFELFSFGINHKWPDQDQILQAFDWMQLEAYKNILIKKDTSEINRIYTKFDAQAKKELKDNELIRAGNSLRRILRNFGSHYDLDSIKEIRNTLIESKKYKKQLKTNTDLLTTEALLTDEFRQQFNHALDEQTYHLNWWEHKISKLKKKEATADPLSSKMYKRLLYKIYAHAIETARYDSSIETIEQRIFCYDICILVYPAYSFPYHIQMQHALQLKNKEQALDYLEKMIVSGVERNTIKLDSSMITFLQDSDRFKTLMED